MQKYKKLKILLMVSWYGEQGDQLKGGNFHYDLAHALNEICDCAIYYPYDKNIQSSYTSKVEWGIRTFRSKYALEKKMQNRINMYFAMKKIIQEFHPDIIHGQVATEAGRFAIMLGEIFHIPVMISEHSAVEASGVQTFPHYYYAKRVYGHSLYNTCVSDDLKKKLESIFPQFEFHTVYNGIPMVQSNEEPVGSYRKDGYVNMVLVAGLYDKKIKGLQYIFPVIKKLKEEGKKIMFHIVGGGTYFQEFKEMAYQLGIETNCVFYGHCEKKKVYSILKDMDFYVSASIFESFGCSIVEAMMMGKPVVATKCGGPESIVNESNGILVDKEDENALYQGISSMMETYMLYSSNEISEYANKKFEVHHIAEEYMKIYEKIIENWNPRKRKKKI